MLLNHHFISYFVWNFHSNWIFFLRVIQENKSGCFFLNTVYWYGKHVHLALYSAKVTIVPHRIMWSWYTDRRRLVSGRVMYSLYSEEGTARGGATLSHSPPSPLLVIYGALNAGGVWKTRDFRPIYTSLFAQKEQHKKQTIKKQQQTRKQSADRH